MGLKTTNYTIEENGLLLPEAYAYIRNLNVYGDRGTAEFVVQANRDKAVSLAPLKTVYVEFEVNRNESPFVTAYNLAKSEVIERRGTHTVTRRMPFYGWTDDIVEV